MSLEKRPLGFVNRRGHSADVSAQELDGLSIDEQPTVSTNDQLIPSTQKPPQSSRKPKPRRRSKWTRRHTVIVIAIVVFIIAVPIIAGELLRAQYLASSDSAKTSLKTLVTSEVLPLQKKSEVTSKQVSAVTDKLETVRDGMCPGGLLDNMATLYPRAKEAHQTCIDERGKIASLVTQLRDMVSMLGYVEAINAALAPVSAQANDAFAVIATQQSNWQQVHEKLQKLNAPSPLESANEQLVTTVSSITDGWSKLNVANNEQNAANFQAAEKQLTDGYNAVRASKDAFAAALSTKQATISQLSRNLY